MFEPSAPPLPSSSSSHKQSNSPKQPATSLFKPKKHSVASNKSSTRTDPTRFCYFAPPHPSFANSLFLPSSSAFVRKRWCATPRLAAIVRRTKKGFFTRVLKIEYASKHSTFSTEMTCAGVCGCVRPPMGAEFGGIYFFTYRPRCPVSFG